jgi:hypothetical protein
VSTSDSQPGRPFPLHFVTKSVIAVAAAAATAAAFSPVANASTTDSHGISAAGSVPQQSVARKPPGGLLGGLLGPTARPARPAAGPATRPGLPDSPLDTATGLADTNSGNGMVLG